MKSFNFTCLNHNLFSSLLIFTICLIHSARNEDDGAQNLRRKDKQKSVTLYLNSKWNETPLHLETAEYLSEEHTDYFWTFIEILHQNANQYRLSNAKQQYDMLLDSADFVLDSPSKFSLLKFSLSLRTYSPTIEMYNQIAMDRRQVFGIESGTCNSFIELSSTSNVTTYVCDIETLSKSLTALRNANDKLTHPNVYKFDHGYSTRDSSLIVAILYGDCISDSFISLYKALKEQTNVNDLKLIVRYYVDHISKEKVALSGYGVELAIKSTEYKAQDDARVKGEKTTIAKNLEEAEQKEDEVVDGIDFSILKDKLPDKKKQLDEFRSHLIERSKEIANFKVWELEELSLQAATKILSAPTNEQLDLLQDISQNFPVVAKSLVNVVTDKHLKMETRQNQMIFMQKMNLAPTDSALFVNGMYFDLESIDVFTLVQYLKQEVRLIEGLYRILGNNQKAQELIKLDISDEKEEYQIDIRDSAVIYINDIENDKTYRSWPASVQEMLRPTFPGMLRSIRRNIYHLVLIVDPSKQESFDLIKLAESFYVHKAPLRIGFVFAVNPNATISGYDDAGVACVNAFNFISQDKSNYDGLSFLTDVIETSAGRDMTSNDVVSLFSSKYPKENVDVVFGSDSAYDTGRVLAWEYLNKTGLGKPMKALLNGVVLKNTHLNGDLFEEAVLMEIMRATAVIQEAVHRGDLLDSMDVLDWLMSRKTVMPRLNDKILASPSSLKQSEFLDFSGNSIAGQLSNDAFEALPRSQALASFKNALHHIYSTSSKCLPITLWLAGDFDIEEHRKILGDALEYLRSNSNFMRLALVYHQNATGVVSRAIEAALNSFKSNASALNFLIKLVSAANDEVLTPEAIFKLVPEDVLPPFKEKFERVDEISDVVGLHRAFVSRFLKLGPRDAAVVVNGRIIKIAENEPLLENDFALIEKHAMLTYGEKVLKQLEKSEEDADRCSDVLMAVGNVLTSHPQQKTRQEISVHKDQHSVMKMKPQQESEPAIEIVAVVEPLSRGAQKLAPILIALKKVINMDVKVFLNCIEKHSEMPLKNFFRFVVQPELTYSEAGALSKPKAHFASMPTSSLLTLGVITLDNWLVGSVYADYDLDNIHLEEVEGSGVMAVFELEYLLLEGHCFDQSTGNPPRGLQFVLGTKSNPALFDTIVMANLGYFQLKANPGAWNLRLRSGRSENIYSIVAHENTDSDESETSDVQVVISNFRSHVVKIRVNKKPGKENEQLLYDNDENDLENSIWGSLASWTSSSTGKKKPENALVNDEESNRLNIFSLASGHLYERLLRIMMLSVLKNTKANVKFWFLKNYLSPGFKQFLPYMAQNYSFEYELVEYKWPRWLRQQSEKQRIIWGYKILFLDVLFPLNVKKIIFVDADQVVRTDLTELRDLDLEGAPYGYTPFCESRKDMDGYRFWKSGYWASHLRGRKYHISALYVVDLQKFRRIAAGDRLRGQYQDLSQDPNSLSNLDQDLPNNMIHQVNIKSLPQEWLWCETWCDDKSKRAAKTIDLCNNPKTKEPKLTAARRVIAEWETYDKEIANLMDEYLAKQRENVIDSIETTGEEQSPLQHTDTHTEL